MTQAVDVERPPATRRGLTLPGLWAFVAVVLPVVAALEASISTIDLAYQVRLGNIMLRTHSLIRADSFTFTALGRPWLDQQWGAQILFALVYRAGGWPALALLRAALVGGIFLFVYLACRSAGASVKWAAWLSLASFLVSVGGLSLRPQLVAMVLFPLTLWLVFDRRSHPRRLWIIPVLVAVWANVHGTFFLGPLLVGFAWLEDLRARSPLARQTLWVGVASVLAANLNPFGLHVWSYALNISSNPVITRLITEWQPPTVRDISGGVFFASVFAVTAVLARRGRNVPWPSLLALGVFFAIGLFAERGIFWWAFAAPPILAQILFDTAAPAGKPASPSRLNLLIAGALIGLGVLFLPWWRPLSEVGSDTALLSEAPPGITAAVERSLGPGERMFNAQRWGSWFEFATPNHRVFVDARIEVFPASVWRNYAEVSAGQEGWQGLLDRWRIDTVVASPDQQRDLIPRIRRDPGWRVLHHDDDGWVFVRA